MKQNKQSFLISGGTTNDGNSYDFTITIKNTPPTGTQGDYELEVHGLSGKEFSKKYVKHR